MERNRRNSDERARAPLKPPPRRSMLAAEMSEMFADEAKAMRKTDVALTRAMALVQRRSPELLEWVHDASYESGVLRIHCTSTAGKFMWDRELRIGLKDEIIKDNPKPIRRIHLCLASDR